MIWLALCSQSGIYSVLADVICILEEYTVPMFQLLCVVQVGRIGKSDITLDLEHVRIRCFAYSGQQTPYP